MTHRRSSRRQSTSGRIAIGCLFVILAGCAPISIQENARGLPSDRDGWIAWWKPERAAWKSWGQDQLQTGDSVFTRGNYYMLLGAINFTDLATKMCEAEFSHVGLVVIEDNVPVVYDISDDGIQATPFENYVTRPGYQVVAVRRPLDSTYTRLPLCVDYIRKQQESKIKFDRRFSLDNEQLYCTELIYEAFRHADIELCDTVRIDELPGRDQIQPATMFLAKRYTGIQDETPLICIGNNSYGLYGSSWLQELLAPTSVKLPPQF